MGDSFHFPPEPGEFRDRPTPDAENEFAFQDAEKSPPAADDPNPYASSFRGDSPQAEFNYETVYPHRGGAVLALGIASFVLTGLFMLMCQPLILFSLAVSIPAWKIGSADLRAIRAGAMDPQGKGMTQAGQWLGIVSMVLAALVTLGFLVWAMLLFQTT